MSDLAPTPLTSPDPEASSDPEAAPAAEASADSEAAPAASPSRGGLGKLVTVVVSGLILAALYRRIAWRDVPGVLAAADAMSLAWAVATIAPITLAIAWRFRWIAPDGAVAGRGEALRLTLVAHVLNLALPAKMGDLAKGYFVARRTETAPAVAVSIVVYERGLDMFGLLSWGLLGWLTQLEGLSLVSRSGVAFLGAAWLGSLLLLASEHTARLALAVLARILPGRLGRPVARLSEGWLALHADLRARPGRRAGLVVFSLALWLLHLTQIWLFVRAVGGQVPFVPCLALSSLTILCALFPFAFAGLGVRDAAFVVLFSSLTSWLSPEQAATVGLLSMTRVFLPALAALPIVRPYVATALGEAAAWRARRRVSEAG